MKTSPEFFTALAERLGWALLHSLWQGALGAAALAVALHFLRRHRAAARHAVCMVAMLLLAASVAVSAWRVRPGAVPVYGMRPEAEMVARNASVAEAAAPLSPTESAPLAASETASSVMSISAAPVRAVRSWRASFEPLLPWISAAWVCGVALLSVRHFAGWRRMGLIRRNGTNARPELQQNFAGLLEKFGRGAGVRLLESADAAVPMLAGLFKPAVLLPLRVVSGLGAREIEAILAHELAHLVRRDAWSNLAQVAIETLFFYHPAMWWIGRRARQERENAADDLTLEVCADRRVYAEALAQLAEMHLGPQAALAATGGSLLARIRRIVRPAPVETPASGWSLGLPALLTALALAAIFRAHADDAKAPPAAIETNSLPDTNELVQKAAKEAQTWIDDMLQTNDRSKQRTAIERPRLAILSDDAARQLAGLIAFDRLLSRGMMVLAFDSVDYTPPREHIIELLKSAEPQIRLYAALCFRGHLEKSLFDLEIYIALADDPSPEVRDVARGYFIAARKEHLTGSSVFAMPSQAPALKALLEKPHVTGEFRESLKDILARCEAPTASSEKSFDWNDLPQPGDRRLRTMIFNNGCTVAMTLGSALPVEQAKANGILHAGETTAAADRTVLHVSADGIVRLDGKAQLLSDLITKLKSAVEHAPDHAVVIYGDKGVNYTFLVQILDACRAAKVWNVAFSTAPEKSAAQTSEPAAQVAAIEKPEIEVEWKGKWWAATVLKKDGEKTHIHYVGFGGEWDEWVTTERVRPIAAAAVSTETPSSKTEDEKKKEEVARRVEKNRQAARVRAADDRQTYQAAELAEIESLYQVANKNWRTEEARASLKKLLEKFDRANRTGCATLYMGQMSEGQERLDYLTRAVEKFSDCYYFNGCQVGGYGRYVLALTLWEKGEKDKARALLAELKTTYKDATDHRGRPMGETTEAVEKELAAKE